MNQNYALFNLCSSAVVLFSCLMALYKWHFCGISSLLLCFICMQTHAESWLKFRHFVERVRNLIVYRRKKKTDEKKTIVEYSLSIASRQHTYTHRTLWFENVAACWFSSSSSLSGYALYLCALMSILYPLWVHHVMLLSVAFSSHVATTALCLKCKILIFQELIASSMCRFVYRLN